MHANSLTLALSGIVMITHMRRRLEDELGHEVLDQTWTYLRDKGYDIQVMSGDMTIADLADEVRQVVRAAGGTVPAHRRPDRVVHASDAGSAESPNITRRMALSLALSELAEGDSFVQDFRTNVLGGQLMATEAVESWIQRQAEVDGQRTRWVQVALEADTVIAHSPIGLGVSPPVTASNVQGVSVNFLAYASADGKYHRSMPTAVGGVLEELRLLSVRLARQFLWAESQATLFVLTGGVPLVNLVGTRVQFRNQLPVLSRITLTIDPTISPHEVADHYASVRRRFTGRRNREITSKHLRLALFAADKTKGSSSRQRMAAWNDEYPQWSYSRVTNFARDCAQARRRLLYPEYDSGSLFNAEDSARAS